MARFRWRPGRTMKVLGWIGALGIMVAGAAYGLGAYYGNLSHVFATTRHNDGLFQHRITLLLLGSSLETSAHNRVLTGRNVQNRSDTLILVSINPKTHQVGVLSIPRDTRVYVPPVGLTKIAEASFFGGAPEAVTVVEDTFHIPVDYYAYLNMFQFAKIINDLGGLTLDIPHAEVYQPNGGRLGIDLKAGVQHLNGWQVLAYARYRNTAEGDIGRIQQQQQILKALAHQLLAPKTIPIIPKLAGDVAHALSSTNLTVNQLIALALFARHLSLSTVRFGTVPGHASTHVDPYLKVPLSYWSYDPHLARILVQDVLLAGPLTAAEKTSLKVVVNSGTASLAPAEALAHQLVTAGYTVTSVGWANRHNHQRTTLINTTGDKWLGGRLAVGLGPTVNDFVPYHTTPWDIKITVGQDYSGHGT